MMDVTGAHLWSRGEGIRVAIIDTGIDATIRTSRGASSSRRISSMAARVLRAIVTVQQSPA